MRRKIYKPKRKSSYRTKKTYNRSSKILNTRNYIFRPDAQSIPKAIQNKFMNSNPTQLYGVSKEVKEYIWYYNGNVTTNVPLASGPITSDFIVPQGLQSNMRIGNKIFVRNIKFRINIFIAAQTTTNCRALFIQCPDGSSSQYPATLNYGDLPQFSGSYANINILDDIQLYRDSSGQDQTTWSQPYFIPINQTYTYASGANAPPVMSPYIGACYLCTGARTSTADQQMMIQVIVSYTDE